MTKILCVVGNTVKPILWYSHILLKSDKTYQNLEWDANNKYASELCAMGSNEKGFIYLWDRNKIVLYIFFYQVVSKYSSSEHVLKFVELLGK